MEHRNMIYDKCKCKHIIISDKCTVVVGFFALFKTMLNVNTRVVYIEVFVLLAIIFDQNQGICFPLTSDRSVRKMISRT